MKEIYVSGGNGMGIGTCMGLGNCMFQIATAAYYCEKYNYKMYIDQEFCTCFEYGTSNMFGRQKSSGNYLNNIFKNIKIKTKSAELVYDIFNKFTDNILPENDLNKGNLSISGYSQNINLFYEIKEKLFNYFYFDDDKSINYIKQKYNFGDINVMVGLRLDTDGGFKYSNLSYKSYKYVMDKIINENKNKNVKFFILSDIDPSGFLINNTHQVTIVNENDILQFYMGLECSHFILSESTYHYWIALLSNIKNKSKVYVFNNTELIYNPSKPFGHYNRNLNFDWEIIEQQNDEFMFLPLKDQSGNDMFRKEVSVPVLKELAINNKECVGFNTLGFFKNNIENITDLTCFGPHEGIYIKKVNSNISSYRLGDLLFVSLKEYEVNKILLEHPNSIGSKYILEKRINQGNNIDVITEIVLEHLKTNLNFLPKDIEDSIVIHLRLGDVIGGNEWHEKAKRPLLIEYFESLFLNDTSKKYVIGNCFFASTSSTNYEECITLSNEYLQKIKFSLQAEHFNSGNADIDLCSAIKAKLFIQGKGFFSKLIVEIRKKLNLNNVEIDN